MKKVLSLLVTFAFLNVQLWAFAPNFPSSAQSASGTYAGVLIPVGGAQGSAASIGVFAVGIPNSVTGQSICTGAAVLFSAGAGYPSLINGIYDPQSKTLTAIIEGTANVSSTTTTQTATNPLTGNPTLTTSTATTQIFAQGNLVATLTQPPPVKGSVVTGGPGTSTAERLQGTATVDLFSSVVGPTPATLANPNPVQPANIGSPIVSSVISFVVNGFQQSSVFTTPTIQIVIPGNNSASGSTGAAGG